MGERRVWKAGLEIRSDSGSDADADGEPDGDAVADSVAGAVAGADLAGADDLVVAAQRDQLAALAARGQPQLRVRRCGRFVVRRLEQRIHGVAERFGLPTRVHGLAVRPERLPRRAFRRELGDDAHTRREPDLRDRHGPHRLRRRRER